MQTNPAPRASTRSSFASAAGGFVTTSVRTPAVATPARGQGASTRR